MHGLESALDDTVPAARPITLEDLLTFRLGVVEMRFEGWACPNQTQLVGAGVDEETIEEMFVDNPRRLLAGA